MNRSKQERRAIQSAAGADAVQSEKEHDSLPCCKHVRKLAYFKWQQAGCPDCEGVEFWLAAEAECRVPVETSEETAGE